MAWCDEHECPDEVCFTLHTYNNSRDVQDTPYEFKVSRLDMGYSTYLKFETKKHRDLILAILIDAGVAACAVATEPCQLTYPRTDKEVWRVL